MIGKHDFGLAFFDAQRPFALGFVCFKADCSVDILIPPRTEEDGETIEETIHRHGQRRSMQIAIGLISNVPVVENQFIEPLPGKRTNRAWGEPVPGLFVQIIGSNPLKDFLQPTYGFGESVYALFAR